jgi:hypothetical protein
MAKETHISGTKALEIISAGGKATRPGWQGWICLNDDKQLVNQKPNPEDPKKFINDGYFFCGEDLLATDWTEVK